MAGELNPRWNTPDVFNKDKALVRVKFGRDVHLLDTELDELQKIQQSRQEDFIRSTFTDGFVNMSAITTSAGILTVQPDTLILDGKVVPIIEPMTLSIAANDNIYLAVSEKVVTHTDKLKKGGNLSGGAEISNADIKDAEMGLETARRVQMQIELTKTNTDNAKSYYKLGKINSAGGFANERQAVQTKVDILAEDVIQSTNLLFMNDAERKKLAAAESVTGAQSKADAAKAAAISAASSDATTKANNALASAKTYAEQEADAALTAAKADATTKAGNAQAAAISSAASDATTKANNALASAKTYAEQEADSALAAAKSDATTKSDAALVSAKSYADAKKSEAISTAASDAQSRADAAKNAAISSAASDATAKANNALNSAKSDASSKADAAQTAAINWAKGFGLGDGVGRLANNVDLNTVVNAGFYRASETHANLPPEGAGYGQLLVIHGADDTIAQMYFKYSQSRVFFRTGNPSNVSGNGAWQSWEELETTDGAQAKVNTFAARRDNPHAVTKSQVGLGNVDNTADSAKSVASAAKLTTARTINGASFNGTANISFHNLDPDAIPGSTDLNNYTTPGMYFCAANATVTTISNTPTNNAFSLLVETHAGTKQTFTEYSHTGGRMFYRNFYSSWGPWIEIENVAGAQAKVNAAISTAAADATTKANAAKTYAEQEADAALAAAKSDATTKANNAQAAAISAAASDATTKANNALASAKSDAQSKADAAKAAAISAAASDATTKANAAETDAINWAKGYGLGETPKTITSTDLNNLQGTGFYMGSSMTNAPNGSSAWFFVISLQHAATYRTQIAVSFNSTTEYKRLFTRSNVSGTWQAWVEEETTAGAQAKADAAKNAAISTASSDATTKANNALNSAKTYAEQQANNALDSAHTYAEQQANAAKVSAVNTASSDATTKANNALASAKSDATTKADAAKAAAISSAASDATTKANDALNTARSYADTKKSEAISAASSDATTKANNALASAKAYVNDYALTNAPLVWTTVPTLNGVQYHSDNSKLVVTRNGNIAMMRGAVKNVLKSDTIIANIPAQFRPVTRDHAFAAPSSDAPSLGLILFRALIDTSGNVTIVANTADTYSNAYWYPIETMWFIG